MICGRSRRETFNSMKDKLKSGDKFTIKAYPSEIIRFFPENEYTVLRRTLFDVSRGLYEYTILKV